MGHHSFVESCLVFWIVKNIYFFKVEEEFKMRDWKVKSFIFNRKDFNLKL